jgi:hypothetical protein
MNIPKQTPTPEYMASSDENEGTGTICCAETEREWRVIRGLGASRRLQQTRLVGISGGRNLGK